MLSIDMLFFQSQSFPTPVFRNMFPFIWGQIARSSRGFCLAIFPSDLASCFAVAQRAGNQCWATSDAQVSSQLLTSGEWSLPGFMFIYWYYIYIYIFIYIYIYSYHRCIEICVFIWFMFFVSNNQQIQQRVVNLTFRDQKLTSFE